MITPRAPRKLTFSLMMILAFLWYPAALFAMDAPLLPFEAASVPPLEEERQPIMEDKGRPLRSKQQAALPQHAESRKNRDYTERLPTIPGIEHELTQHWITYYTTKGRLQWLASVLRNGEPYLGFIRNEIAERGLPPELLYLPVIESGFTVTARSRSGASGLWQFMRNSMSPWLKLDDWVDERYDFWKSTQAAFSKLEGNYRQFGSWPMALAAYNSGGGAIARIIKENRTNDYWYLAETKKFKTESLHYVPKLLAVYYIISNPRKFNLDISTPPVYREWTRVPVPGQINLAVLAEHAGIETAVLRSSNRELLTMVTPPGDGYMLKVRTQDAPAIKAALERDDITLVKQYLYTIRQGDTLFALAQYYGVTVEGILAQNPGLSARALLPGAKIAIPALREVTPYNPPKAAAVSAPPAPNNTPRDISWTGNHVIKPGDTLWSLSRLYQISVEQLARANSISPSAVLSVGKTLRVPR